MRGLVDGIGLWDDWMRCVGIQFGDFRELR